MAASSDINSRVVSKHCLKFKDDVKHKETFLDMGFVHMILPVSQPSQASSSAVAGLLPSDIKLFSSKIARVSDIISTVQFDFASCEHCFLICKGAAYDCAGQTKAFISYLRDNTYKAAVIVVNEQTRRKAYMTGMSKEEVARAGGYEGFKVHFTDIELKQQQQQQQSAREQSVATSAETKIDFTFKPSQVSYVSTSTENVTSESAVVAPFPSSSNKRGHEQTMAADHYGAVVRNRSSRHESFIYHLRELNNWVKTALITTIFDMAPKRYCRGPVAVLDVGCGKGGDIDKWLRCKSSKGIERYVGVDIAIKSLQHFVSERLVLQSAGDRRKFTKLVCADLGTDVLTSSTLETYLVTSESVASSSAGQDGVEGKIIGKWSSVAGPMSNDEQYDIVSCQFALHYFFQTSEKCGTFFRNVHKHLKGGRHFVTSTIDSRRMAELLLRQLCTTDASDSPTKELKITNAFGDTLLRVAFDNYQWKRLLSFNSSYYDRTSRSKQTSSSGKLELTDEEYDALFGIQYTFVLGDNEDEQAVNAPEWIVPCGRYLEHIAERFGLRVTYYENNHKFISERIKAAEVFPTPSNMFLKSQLENRNAFNYKGRIEDAEWDICGLYAIIIFEKVGTEEQEEEEDARGEESGALTPEGSPPSTPPYAFCPSTPPTAPP